MRIMVMCHNLTSAGGRSVGVNLVGALAASDSQHEFLMIVPSGDDYRTAAAVVRGTWKEVSFDRGASRLMWEVATARRTAREFRADWIVALGNLPVVVSGIRSAVLLHNPHLFYNSTAYRPDLVRHRAWLYARRRYLQRLLPSVDLVFAQTRVAANRVRDTYGVSDIVVLPNAVSSLIDKSVDDAPVAVLSGGPFRFLALTRYYPHKNLEVLARMFDEHRDTLDGITGYLTIDPQQHPGAGELLGRISRAGLDDRLVNLGPLDQRALAGVYRRIDAMVLPTLLESSSGTYLESMSLGVPIVTSDLDFAHDVCGDAAIYVDPHDPGNLAESLGRLRDDPRVGRALAHSGYEIVKEHQETWPEIATRLLHALEERS